MAKIAINGFGRIGRLVLRAAWPILEFVHINEIQGGTTAAHLLKFDSVHGRWASEVAAASDEQIELKGKLNGLAVRVPLLNASLTDCVFEVTRPTTVYDNEWGYSCRMAELTRKVAGAVGGEI
ncbi:glyceraldehyde-3-phosphate dehydrogenase [Leptolyngbya sp. Heron Island J]|uniref:glyceraldehyde 3-phosphate dehydrogenase NAD-binding domain-containing protein n=1 Tax=Leptolyngbya sp. Heron Island J TaxID=1385935 RepID=UPI0003B9F5FA|nr:glyceraldehyde 3-phosphate dehydrogenase NAD-binding domain-containing protein [Leptolyngbya sp. Heron Island J]ESA36435.1 glyceraldehyde-3-phosphate dehydrogenase [Leptolyngbya sp. Heron Island J]